MTGRRFPGRGPPLRRPVGTARYPKSRNEAVRPDIPGERLKILRDAFNAMANDPDLVADIRKLNVELDPLPGERVQALITRTLAVPASVRERAKVAFGR